MCKMLRIFSFHVQVAPEVSRSSASIGARGWATPASCDLMPEIHPTVFVPGDASACQNRYGNALYVARPWSPKAIPAPNASRHCGRSANSLPWQANIRIPHGTGLSVGANVPSSLRLTQPAQGGTADSRTRPPPPQSRDFRSGRPSPTDHLAAANRRWPDPAHPSSLRPHNISRFFP